MSTEIFTHVRCQVSFSIIPPPPQKKTECIKKELCQDPKILLMIHQKKEGAQEAL
jgi:hypothetical protein